MSAIKPQHIVTAPAPIMAAARENCAGRLRARGHEAEAEAFQCGERDQTWAMHHEVEKLKGEGV